MNAALQRVAEMSRRLAHAEDLDSLLDVALVALAELWGFGHSMVLVLDDDAERLITLASHGYEGQGVGSEVIVGTGIIGVVARTRRAVRIGNVSHAMRYGRAARKELKAQGHEGEFSKEIPLPGLPNVDSQLAVPMLAQGQLIGVICVEDESSGAFDEVAEQALCVAGNQIGAGISLAGPAMDIASSKAQSTPGVDVPSSGPPIAVRYYEEDSSIFIDGEYLIKSLPGRILWRLLVQHRDEQRCEFTNKELRLDTALGLPPVKDNLETRLILLRRRLEERSDGIRMCKVGRGRFRLEVGRGFVLEEIS